jgi:uncharacterized membrane protein YbaN (DUF454 family)
MKHILRSILGITFLVLGVIGLFLPVLQGILFLVVGLLILAPESRRIRALLKTLRLRYPDAFAAAERFKKKFTGSGRSRERTDTTD